MGPWAIFDDSHHHGMLAWLLQGMGKNDTRPPQARLSNRKYQWTSVLSRHIVTEMIGRLPLADELPLRMRLPLLVGYMAISMDAASC